MGTTISLRIRLFLSDAVVLLLCQMIVIAGIFFSRRVHFRSFLVDSFTKYWLQCWRTQNKTISCSLLEPPFYSCFAQCLKAGILSFSVMCIPTRDTHITSDMCTGIHISRGYTYHCDTGTRNSSRGCLEPRLLDFTLLFGGSLFEFSMNFQLNDRRRKANPSAFLVRSLEAVRCEFLGENRLGAGPVWNMDFLPCFPLITYSRSHR